MKEPDNEPSEFAAVSVSSSSTSDVVNVPPSFFSLVFLPLPEISLRIISFTSIVSTSSFASNKVTLLLSFSLNFLLPDTPIPPILIDLAPISAGVPSVFLVKLRPADDDWPGRTNHVNYVGTS